MWQFKDGVVIDGIRQFTTLNGGFSDHHTSFEPQHVYFISDDEPQNNDWCIVDNISVDQYFEPLAIHRYKKIISATDTLIIEDNFNTDADDAQWARIPLNVPRPSQQWIEKYLESYNKGEVITDVEVELACNESRQCSCDDYNPCLKPILKVNPTDNTITIKSAKDSWSRDEVLAFGLKCGIAGTLAEKSKTEFYKLYLELVEKNL